MIRLLAAASLVLGFLSSVPAAWGDGGFFPKLAVETPPQIPLQRAVIIHRDGIETLLVESSYKTQSSEVGWVLPVPAAPTKLAVGEPGVPATLAVCFAPNIVHNEFAVILVLLLLLLLILVPVALVVIFAETGKSRREAIIEVLAIVPILLLFFALLLPSLGSAGGHVGPPMALEVLQAQRVGNYDVSVLRASSPADLSAWLEKSGVRAIGPGEQPIIADYIARKWCFVVARLSAQAGNAVLPHPISVQFPASQPVFPMKLTAMAGGKTQVELFVIADSQVQADNFKTVFAGCLKAETDSMGASTFSCERFHQRMALPEAASLMWDGCYLTRLRATLSAEQMGQDVALTSVSYSPKQADFYSYQGRRYLIYIALLIGGIIFLLLATWAFQARRRPSRREAKVLLAVPILTGLAVGLIWLLLPVVETTNLNDGLPFGFTLRHRQQMQEKAAWSLISEGKLNGQMTDAEFSQFPQLARQAGFLDATDATNPLTDQPIRMERSPGNYSIRRVGKATFFCTYDRHGAENRTELSDRPLSQPDIGP